jgi:hypothetical protein
MSLELRALRYADLASWAHAAAVHQSFTSTLSRLRHARFRRQVYRYLSKILRGHGLHELVTVERIHDAFAFALGETGTRYVGDKYPDYVLQYPRFIHQANTRCVFVYRDVRDVVASIMERIHRGDWQRRTWATRYNTIEKATDYWLEIMAAMSDIRRLETNVLTVRYEDLVQKSGATLGALAQHLELAPDGFDAHMADASSVGRFRERLSPDQVRAIERGDTQPSVPNARSSRGPENGSSCTGVWCSVVDLPLGDRSLSAALRWCRRDPCSLRKTHRRWT